MPEEPPGYAHAAPGGVLTAAVDQYGTVTQRRGWRVLGGAVRRARIEDHRLATEHDREGVVVRLVVDRAKERAAVEREDGRVLAAVVASRKEPNIGAEED